MKCIWECPLCERDWIEENVNTKQIECAECGIVCEIVHKSIESIKRLEVRPVEEDDE